MKKSYTLIVFILITTILLPNFYVDAKVQYVTKQNALNKIIKKLKTSNFTEPSSNLFKNVKSRKSIKKKNRDSINYAIENKVITKAKKFKPNAKVKRMEFAQWVYKALNVSGYQLPIVKKSSKLPFKDVKGKNKKVVSYLYSRELIAGQTRKKFAGKKKLTKAQFNSVIKAVNNSIKKAKSLQPPAVQDGADKLLRLEILKNDNPQLPYDVTVKNLNKNNNLLLPSGINLKKIVARFKLSDGYVVVNGIRQISGKTTNNFSKPLQYAVYDKNGKSQWYKINLNCLDTGLPSVIINTKNNVEIKSKRDYVEATLQISGGTVSYARNLPETPMLIKGRGNTTWGLDKKPYRMKFEKPGVPVLGMKAERNWILLANYLDRTLMRNHIAFETLRKFPDTGFVPRFKFVDVFINGQFQGNYQLGDHIQISKNRVNVKEEKNKDVDTGFLLEQDIRADKSWAEPDFVKGVDYFVSKNGINYVFKDPDGDELTETQRNNIRDYINKCEDAINNAMRDQKTINELIDRDSFIDWLIIEELFKNVDSGVGSHFYTSVFLHKDVGGKLKLGPAWDFDFSSGNHASEWWYSPEGWSTYSASGWFPKIFNLHGESNEFKRAMGERWRQIKPIALDTIYDTIDETSQLLQKSQTENFKIWPMFNQTMPSYSELRAANTYDKQVDFLKNWFRIRIKYLDDRISNW